MKEKRMLIMVALTVFSLSMVLSIGFSQGSGPQTFPADKGPATIDVSKYPPNMKKAYNLFVERCSKCHSLARTINANRFGKASWEPMVKKMSTRPGSDVTPQEEKIILDFIVFDTEKRKAAINKFWISQKK